MCSTNGDRDHRVVLTRCRSYSASEVREALESALEPLGGMGAFVSPGDQVLVKPNLLTRAKPERAVTTHPEVVRALIALAREAGGLVSVGDSPGGINTPERWLRLAETTGMAAVCADEGAGLLLFDDFPTVGLEAAGAARFPRFEVAGPVASADVIIDVPKLKTHGFMALTGAVKNMFGCIPGPEKAALHLKAPERSDFADMLVDLARACRPALVVMDAVIAMEGQGPSAGRPREVGAILASADPFPADLVACALAGVPVSDAYTVRAALRRGIGPASLSEVTLEGELLDELSGLPFEMPLRDPIGGLPPWMAVRLRGMLTPRPYVAEKCASCGRCVEACPVDAIELHGPDGKVAVDYDRCIRCYCCQELCPHQRIELRSPPAARFLGLGR